MDLEFLEEDKYTHCACKGEKVQEWYGIKNDPESSYVEIEGLLWARENTPDAVTGQSYVVFDHRDESAAAEGLRVPTSEELYALRNLGFTWDDVLKGGWFGYDHELKSESKQSIFLPALGRDENGTIVGDGTFGEYWAGPVISGNAHILRFTDERTSVVGATSNTSPNRCVRGVVAG